MCLYILSDLYYKFWEIFIKMFFSSVFELEICSSHKNGVELHHKKNGIVMSSTHKHHNPPSGVKYQSRSQCALPTPCNENLKMVTWCTCIGSIVLFLVNIKTALAKECQLKVNQLPQTIYYANLYPRMSSCQLPAKSSLDLTFKNYYPVKVNLCCLADE